MRRSLLAVAAIMSLVAMLALFGCAGQKKNGGLENGEYQAAFNTDSNMFHVNEANEGMGVLTVTDEGMNIHVSLVSKNIVNLYVGTADKAEHDEGNWLQPTTDTVTYEDGTSQEVYGFDIPVQTLDQDFDLAILGKSGKWFDHKVSVSNPEKKQAG